MNGSVAASPGPGVRPMPDELGVRRLVIRAAQIAAVIAVVALAISAVPGLGSVRARLGGANPVWITAVALAEVGSCFGYLLVFRSTFCSQMSWGLSYDIAMAELAANSLLPAGGAGGLALGVWALRQAGMPTGHIARRTRGLLRRHERRELLRARAGGDRGVRRHRGRAAVRLALTLVPRWSRPPVPCRRAEPELLRALGERGARRRPIRAGAGAHASPYGPG